MKTNPLVAVLSALVLTVSAEARAEETSINAKPAHALLFSADDARTALAKAFAEGRRGRIEFSLRGKGLDRDIAADCDVAASSSPDSRAAAAASPSSIKCRFHEGGEALPARLVLKDLSSGTGADMAPVVRYGTLRFDGLELQIASKDSELGQQTGTSGPSEYVFSLDGVAVGYLELSEEPRLRFVAADDKRTRRAVMLGATAIGVLWSPRSSNLAALADQPAAR